MNPKPLTPGRNRWQRIEAPDGVFFIDRDRAPEPPNLAPAAAVILASLAMLILAATCISYLF